MNKKTAINICKQLLKLHVYARPVQQTGFLADRSQYDVIVSHFSLTDELYDMLETTFGLSFLDGCMYLPRECGTGKRQPDPASVWMTRS